MIGQQPLLNRQRLFTVADANATLPLIRAIVTDLVRLAQEVSDRSERLSCLLSDRGPVDEGDPYAEELLQVVEQLEQDRRRLQEYVDELLELGVEPTSAVEGLVDFPAVINGRTVCLCWKLGESDIQFWHEIDQKYADRRPLTIDVPAEPTLAGTCRVC